MKKAMEWFRRNRQTMLFILIGILLLSWLTWRSWESHKQHREWRRELAILEEQERLGLTEEEVTKLKAQLGAATAELEANPSYEWLRANRAEARARYGDYKGAMEDFRIAQQQGEGVNSSWLGLANVLYEREQDEMSLAVYDSIYPSNGERYPVRGLTFAKLLFCSTNPKVRNPERAVKLVERSMQIPAEREEDLYAYSEALAAAGHFNEAVMAIDRALRMVSDNLAERGKALESLQKEKAKEDPKLKKKIDRLQKNQQIDENNKQYYQQRRAFFLRGEAPPPKRY